jgi:hypothetical protein
MFIKPSRKRIHSSFGSEMFIDLLKTQVLGAPPRAQQEPILIALLTQRGSFFFRWFL